MGDQDLAFRCDPRAGVVRRRVLVISADLNKRRLWEIWRALLRARSIENLALVVLDPEHGRTWQSRLAFVAVIGGAPLRERGPAWPVVAVGVDRIPLKKDC